MKQQAAIIIATLVIIAAVVAMLIMRKDLCEIRFRTDQAELSAVMACEPVK
ncbi:Hok/Gef family protein [[Erwinia] mediterraneensis]|uniref:Hok/Gef family protein n=1 Tax=[Erwinia] mediterraneensis TaxID=2161819 RepID=UPI001030988F|nr:Hok/Gef family protein [[Erwinia] mediterraneensis]